MLFRSALRHQSRFWKLVKGPYSPSVYPGITTSNVTIYAPGSYCNSWMSKGVMEAGFRSDLRLYTNNVPGATNLNQPLPQDLIPGYIITRSVTTPTSQASAINGTATPSDATATTLRVTYTITPSANEQGKLSFERTADIQIPAQFSC